MGSKCLVASPPRLRHPAAAGIGDTIRYLLHTSSLAATALKEVTPRRNSSQTMGFRKSNTQADAEDRATGK